MRRMIAMTTVAGALAAACAGTDTPPAPAPAPSATRGSPTVVARPEWVAVFHVARDPRDLEDDTAELMRTVPRSLIVGPVGCHRGLGEKLGAAAGDYFSGVVARTQSELDRAVADARRSPAFGEPVFRGELEVLC